MCYLFSGELGPLHAWNEDFLKLCVFDCGRYLRSDSVSLARERFDYARILISTSSLEVVNVIEKYLVDGVLVEIKMVEEWGFNMGEDACLFEDDANFIESSSKNVEILDDMDTNHNADVLVDKIVRDLKEAVVKDGQSDNDDWCERVNLDTMMPNDEQPIDH